MIRNAEVINFRGLKEARLSDCKRVNIVVGANASGKTALLEALFLASGGSPEIVSRFRSWRGVELGAGHPMPADYLFRDMFNGFRKDTRVSISLETDPYGPRKLEIYYNNSQVVQLSGFHPNMPQQFVQGPISFDWTYKGGSTSITPLMGPLGAVQMPNSAPMEKENFFFTSGNNYSSAETATRFSTLSQQYKHQEVVDIFTSEFPQITGIGVEIFNGIPALAGSVEEIPQKLPLSLISGGVNKFATLLCSIHGQENSISFIDEIENGFYFERFPSLWRHLYGLAVKNDAQIFASTHSAECLEAASMLAADHPDDFAVVHMEREGPHRMAGNQLVFAFEQKIEIR